LWSFSGDERALSKFCAKGFEAYLAQGLSTGEVLGCCWSSSPLSGAARTAAVVAQCCCQVSNRNQTNIRVQAQSPINIGFHFLARPLQ